MSKLLPENKFFDFSDYGRGIAKIFAKSLLNSVFTPVHVTFLFMISGGVSIYLILEDEFIFAGIFLILKSIIDAADGELARLREKPSYIGRYLDSVFDLVLNFALLLTISYVTYSPFWLMLIAFFCVQLQGTVFNYYYTILRNNKSGGDTTSRVEEKTFPKALHGENQRMVNFLFVIYTIFYGGFDRILIGLDRKAMKIKNLPNWFMTFVSIYGLGFQLLIISILLSTGAINFIIPFFIGYSIFIVFILAVRKVIITN
ncbi:MAG: CDP-alcohol phosphatidyltransferase family protein [Flavobacteriales bacterium]|tara:strand:- start:1128 stop:1901 length:774 start_codon:yes stop_codon:yes gene_type:complete